MDEEEAKREAAEVSCSSVRLDDSTFRWFEDLAAVDFHNAVEIALTYLPLFSMFTYCLSVPQ